MKASRTGNIICNENLLFVLDDVFRKGKDTYPELISSSRTGYKYKVLTVWAQGLRLG